jgi:hypothetical protein
VSHDQYIVQKGKIVARTTGRAVNKVSLGQCLSLCLLVLGLDWLDMAGFQEQLSSLKQVGNVMNLWWTTFGFLGLRCSRFLRSNKRACYDIEESVKIQISPW